jgi:AcrR family transcriptional regulator
MPKERLSKPPTRTTTRKKSVVRERSRLSPELRAKQILEGAIAFFAEHGFSGQTRELTAELGISKGLLYRYFPSKDALIDRVYEDVFLHRWNPDWDRTIADRGQPLADRLAAFYVDYAAVILAYDWVRIYLFSGLAGASLNRRYARRVEERIYKRVIGELRHEFGFPPLDEIGASEPELEMMWNLHGSIFYIGLRKWVYGIETSIDVEAAVRRMVEGLYAGAKATMARTVGS